MHIRFGNVTHYIYFLPAYSVYSFPSLSFFRISTQSVLKNKHTFTPWLVCLIHFLSDFFFSFNLLFFLSGNHKKPHSTQCNLVEQITDRRGSARKTTKKVLIGDMSILLVSMVMEDSDTVSRNSKTFEEETSIERKKCLMLKF